jgi:hypothetical protein
VTLNIMTPLSYPTLNCGLFMLLLEQLVIQEYKSYFFY